MDWKIVLTVCFEWMREWFRDVLASMRADMTVRELMRRDEHFLRDIGVRREELMERVRGASSRRSFAERMREARSREAGRKAARRESRTRATSFSKRLGQA